MHHKFARANFDGASAQAGDIIHSRLQCAIVGADQVRVELTDRYDGAVLHFGMHRARELLFVGSWRELLLLSCGYDSGDRQCDGDHRNVHRELGRVHG